MSNLIALEIANELDLEDVIVCREAAAAIREQHAEIERLTAERDSAISAAISVDREACAAVCDEESRSWKHATSLDVLCMMLSNAIRARAKQ